MMAWLHWCTRGDGTRSVLKPLLWLTILYKHCCWPHQLKHNADEMPLSRSEAIRPTRTNCFRLCVALTHSFVLPWPPVQSTFAHPYLAVTCAHTIYCITLHFLYILSYYTCFYCLLDLSYYFIFYYIYVTSYLYVNKNQYSRTNSWYC